MLLLTGDIGGTNTRLAIAETGPGGFRWLAQRRYPSRRYEDLSAVLRTFLADAEVRACGPADSVCLGVAGPIRGSGASRTVRVTNLPWEISETALQSEFNFSRLRLVNDFQAAAYGVEMLSGSDLALLQPGEAEPRGVRAVIGAGTGLGQALLVWQSGRYEALATEGGHVDFGPTDEEQIGLWRFLRARFDRVGYERILCGSGLVLIYEFLGGGTVAASGEDGAAMVSAAALSGSDPVAVRALDLFLRIFGSQAGNLALSALATGGVYVAGGIAPRLLSRMQEQFIPAFRAKGRMSSLLASIPIQVILQADVGLLGAAVVAARE